MQAFRRKIAGLWVGLACFLGAGCTTIDQDRLSQLQADGLHRFNQGDFLGAREDFENALTLKPEDANLLYNVGQCYDRQGDRVKAEKWYRQCLEKSDQQGECRYALIVLLDQTGRRPEAEKMIQDWLKLAPDQPGPYTVQAWVLRREKAYPQAQSLLQQALNLDPHYVHALIELGLLYEDMNLPERSLVLYERALAQDPNQAEIAQRLESLRQKNVGRPQPD